MTSPMRPDRLTRRAFLARAAAIGVSAVALGPVLEACAQVVPPGRSPGSTPGRSPVVSPVSPPGGALPVVDPTPTSAAYGAMLELSALAPVAVPAALRALLDEIAADVGVPVAQDVVEGRRQARLTVTSDDPSFATQAYRLEIGPTTDGPLVTIRSGDEAGALNGLLSLARLAVVDGGAVWLRAATVDDAPGFARRGAILDPWILPDTGVTAASRALLVERVRFGARFKLNFVDILDRNPWPELVRFCDTHHVELMNGLGYQDRLTTTPRDQVRAQLAGMLDAGSRSFSFAWDDIATTNPEALARVHAGIVADLYRYVRDRDPGIRVSVVLPPYGGIPGERLVGARPGDGERYLAVMRDALPGDVRVFWTGDGGVFSSTVTAAGARAYGDAVGHELGLWDNDTIGFSRDRRPCSGRAPDLSSVVHTYMGNLAGEANWGGTNGEFALLTSLFYTWNPAFYDPDAAAAAADRILAVGSATTN